MTANTYLVKAIDNYPYNLEECMEALEYALAYEQENPIAHCLMGRLQMEYFMNYAEALFHFEAALAADVRYVETYYPYIRCLITVEAYQKAAKLIDFVLTRKAIDKAKIYELQAMIAERELRFKKALKVLEQAKLHAQTEAQMDRFNTSVSRLEAKLKLENRLKSKKA